MDLIHVETETACPRCGAPVRTETWTMQPLLRHGGYGAALRTVRRWCSALCGWWTIPEVAEERPL